MKTNERPVFDETLGEIGTQHPRTSARGSNEERVDGSGESERNRNAAGFRTSLNAGSRRIPR
ncbi:MAG: hypothetical protein IKY61_07130, partial [Thermoguttaceae bacterium]|nr:hypothetical protein [Thermoguttaceae bacterium]